MITRLSNADNRSLIDSLGLGSVVCPKDLCSNNIARYVRAMKNQTGARLCSCFSLGCDISRQAPDSDRCSTD